MAKYSKKAQDKIEKVMHEYKEGELESGPGGKGGKVKDRKQAIAIALSEARESGAKVPPKKSSSSKKSSSRSRSGAGRKSRPSARKSEPSGSKSKATSKKSATAKRKSSPAAS